MPVKNQTGYLALLLMLAALKVEINPAQATVVNENNTVQGRIARIKQVLQQKSLAMEGESSQLLLPKETINGEEVSIWADWGDRGRRRGGRGSWVDAWSPGWGDWGDTGGWGDWGDLW